MKTKLKPERGPSAAYALLMVLVMVSVAIAVMAATMTRTTNVWYLNERHNQYVITLNAAEAATEKVIARMRYDYGIGNDVSIVNNLGVYRTSAPNANENSYWGNFLFSDAQGNAGRTYVQCISNQLYVPLQSQYYGLSGWRTVYRVLFERAPDRRTVQPDQCRPAGHGNGFHPCLSVCHLL